jgi:hypothetical protein
MAKKVYRISYKARYFTTRHIMISKSVSLVIALLTLLGLAAPTGGVLQLQTVHAQSLGDDDIANIVDDALNTAFSAAGIDGEEEEEEEDEEEETATEEAEATDAEEQSAGDDIQDIDQTQDQRNEQDQDAEQEVDQESSQDETNIQANELDTGDNTATVAQSNDVDEDDDEQDGGQDVAAAAEASDEEEEDSDSTDADATAEATGIVDQSNTATVRQNSSINNVDLSNNVAFGDDTNTQIAVPIIDQDQRAANLAEQRAANLDLDIVRVQQPTPTPTTQPPEEEEQPPAGTCDPSTTDCFCFRDVAGNVFCFFTDTECNLARGNTEVPPETECVEVGPG